MIKNLDKWIFSYIVQRVGGICQRRSPPLNVAFCMVDHFEPFGGRADRSRAWGRVKSWIERYPAAVDRHFDSMENRPRHTFFYPEEEYDADCVNSLVGLCERGYGEVEIHLHHDHDTSEETRQKLLRFKELLAREHGLLSTDHDTGKIVYGFIHGNWALDNSRDDGRWCGVNDELSILQETGCYADFTLPSAPSDTQTNKINSIYYVVDHPDRPKSHNRGIDAQAGKSDQNGLLIVQGPLGLNWRSRKLKILPRIENSSLTHDNPVTLDRAKLWVKLGPQMGDQGRWIFVKLHTHGCQERDMEYLLSEGLDMLYATLESCFNDGKNYVLHYVSAREMFNLIKALEANTAQRLASWRDYPLRRNIEGL